MSHEIRTPMNGILGLTEITLQRTLSAEARADLMQIHESAMALLGILNDVLDQSKLEAGRLTLERGLLDIEPSLATLHSFFYRVATAKGLEFRAAAAPSVPRYLLGDAMRLQQVLSNLVGNALKFTDRGAVQVRVRRDELVGSQASLVWTVADTGIGMDAATLDRLFQPFTQGDDPIARRFGGTGLGLNISRHLAGLMGGTLTVASTPGAGTTFTLRIRLEVAAAPTTDGLTATQRIRENPAWATLPVIALTAGVTPPERVRMRTVGMSDLLAKPVTLDALRVTLARRPGGPRVTARRGTIRRDPRPGRRPGDPRLRLPGVRAAHRRDQSPAPLPAPVCGVQPRRRRRHQTDGLHRP